MNKQQKGKTQIRQISVSARKSGDEGEIVDLLNLCYPGGWGNMAQWEWRYPQNPSSESSSIFIIERNSQIVGHRGSHHRWLVIRGKKIPVIFLGDTAIHPDMQGMGLYSSLHQTTLDAAKRIGACLALTHNSRGSITYKRNKQTGFVEINDNPTYIKAINYTKVFKKEVSAFISRRGKLKALFRGLETNLYIHFDEHAFSLKEILDESNSTVPESNKRDMVGIILTKDSLPLLIRFADGGKFEKVKSIIRLLFTQKMKIKMRAKFSSIRTLVRIAWVGIRMMKYV